MSGRLSQEEWEATLTMVGVVVGCLLKQDGKYLLVQEGQPGAYGLWNLPAGHVDKGEELEAAALREVKEETGYDARLIEEIALYHETATKSVKHIYLAEITGGELKPQPEEIMDVKWLTFGEVIALRDNGLLRKPWVWDIIQKDYYGGKASSVDRDSEKPSIS